MEDGPRRTGLILSGGGARAAYQVGVLMAIAEISPRDIKCPFDIICGTSAGAINASALASQAVHFRTGVRGLERIWGNLTAESVYRTDWSSFAGLIFRWLMASIRRGESHLSYSLLDNSPLAQLLEQVINFKKIQRQLEAGNLYALSITAAGYSSGESVSFYQTVADIPDWRRVRRIGVPTQIRVEHLLASSALPILFPAVKINREYFGDGAIRQLAPLSPALHLGARKILVIGVSGIAAGGPRRISSDVYPSAAQIIGHVLNSAFVDAFEADVERLERINRTVRSVPEEVRRANRMELREVELLKIFPSQPLDEIAARHAHELPRNIRALLSGSGALKRGGGTAVSYLLFEQGFCRELMALGYTDAIARREEIAQFLNLPVERSESSSVPVAAAS
ncbi:MAG: patatin-like phospholipase family protein [Pseudomonadota bacterium]